MKISEAIEVLKLMKKYYTDVENIGEGCLFNDDEVEAVNMAIEALKQKAELGQSHQKLDRNLFKEIMSNADKMCAFVQMQRGIHNFIEVMEDIDISVDVQSRRESD